MDYNYSSSMNKRRHTLPSSSFVDPAIVRFIERATSSSSLFDQEIVDEEDIEEDDDDDQRTTITTVSLPSHLENHKSFTNNTTTTTTKLNQLWTRQYRYEDLELRLLSLEVTKKRFERRLQELENNNAYSKTIILQQQQQQPMKPDQQPSATTSTRQVLQGDNRLTEYQTHDKDDDKEVVMVTNQKYMELLSKHESLTNKYNATQIEFKEKESYYKQRIQELLAENKNLSNKQKQQQKKEEEEEEEPSYKEEDGYLIFDTTNMNGEIIHCKVKIPTPSMALASPPATRVSSPQYQSPLTPLPSNHHLPPKKNKGLNFNAPEWKVTTTTNRSTSS